MPLSSPPPSLAEPSVALVDRVYQVLLDSIITGELGPGEPVREVEIAEALGVSRTPVREAFRRLAMIDLIIIEVNRGSHVAPIEPGRLRETGRVIAELCGLAAKLASPNLTEEDQEFFIEMELELFTRVINKVPPERTSQAADTIARILDRADGSVITEAILARRPHLLRLFYFYGHKIPLLPMAERTAAIASAARVKDSELLSVAIRSFYEHITNDLVDLAVQDAKEKAGIAVPQASDGTQQSLGGD